MRRSEAKRLILASGPVVRRTIGVAALVFAVLLRVTPVCAEKRVALVIGNSAYEHTRALPNARNDARAIATLLTKIGFAVTETADLSYRPMREAIRNFGVAAQGAEMALVYYAGHGLEVAGENWLLPVSSAFKHESDLEYEAISLSSILAAVKNAGQLRLVILDACRNNPLGERIELSAGATRSVARGLARIEPSGDILVAYSAKHGTLAEDGLGTNSPFAGALLQHMPTPGLVVRIMFGRVRDAVRKATGGRQEPFTYGSVGGDVVALLAGPEVAKHGLASTPSGVQAVELAFWATVKDSRDPVVIQSYLDAHPNGRFAPLARVLANTLKLEAEQRSAMVVRELEAKKADKANGAEALRNYQEVKRAKEARLAASSGH